MGVKPGYKQTEVGVIPKEWKVSTLGQICSFENGDRSSNYPSPGSFRQTGIPFINAGHVSEGQISSSEMNYITQEAYRRLGGGKVKAGDILFCLRGSLGKFGVVSGDFGQAAIASSLVIIRPKAPAVSREYLSCYFSSALCAEMIETWSGGAAQPNLGAKDLARFSIPLPPSVPEQRAIATASSDVDGLLGGLDRLIAKKRDLKLAAMQQLLIGETRLPGFHGDWEVKTLGHLGSTYGGLTGKTKTDFGEGETRYITFMNVMSNVVIDCATFGHVKISTTEAQNRAKKGDLFFNGSSETPEEVAMCAVLLEEVGDVYLNSFCFGFRRHDAADADGLFLAYYLRSKEGRELMKSLAQGSTRYNLSKVALLKSPLRLPSVVEQTAIAEVLTDMDMDLVALERRRAKTCDLKLAMMQELLTGKTRLV